MSKEAVALAHTQCQGSGLGLKAWLSGKALVWQVWESLVPLPTTNQNKTADSGGLVAGNRKAESMDLKHVLGEKPRVLLTDNTAILCSLNFHALEAKRPLM